MSHPTGLVGLPTEILVEIFEHPPIPNETLYSLALLCRRLHFIALPLYFSRHGMGSAPNSVLITMRTDRRDLLRALQTALFTPETPNITCVFPHPSCTSIFPLLPHLRRLERFISRLPSVNDVTLRFDTRGSVCLSVGDDQALKAWASALGALLNCVVRSRCNSLTILSGGQFTWAYELAPSTRRITRNSLMSFLRIRSRDMNNFRRVSRQGESHVEMTMPSNVSRTSHLTSLDIQSAILIVPPALHWTLAAVRNCHSISLSLSPTLPQSMMWSIVLPLIASAAQNVTRLSLWRTECIPDLDVLAFIAGLPRLTHLMLSGHGTNTIQHHRNPLIEFRHLQSLRAPPNFILYFLRHPTCFPQIKNVHIMARTTHERPPRLIHSLIRDHQQTRRLRPGPSISCIP
ncbi:hypothetical protein FB451DRAFT_508294 [Mycena latifolia]|nr:hypothetical protein FB451DRAFT_508294 [Mycena latifolia]